MSPILPAGFIPIAVDQAQIGLMHQRSGLEGVSRRFGRNLPPGNKVKLPVERRPQLLMRSSTPLTRRDQKPGDLTGFSRLHRLARPQ